MHRLYLERNASAIRKGQQTPEKVPAPNIKKYPDKDLPWSKTTVNDILRRQEYLGHTVHFKTEQKSYKNHKRRRKPLEDALILQNTHETVFSQEDFDLVQQIRSKRYYLRKNCQATVRSSLIGCSHNLTST